MPRCQIPAGRGCTQRGARVAIDPWHLQRWGRALKVGGPTKKLILQLLTEAADYNTATCHPSQETLAAWAEVSERTVRASLRDLEAAGVIERRARHRANGNRTSDSILLLAPGVVEWPDGTLAERATTGSQLPPENIAGGSQLPVDNRQPASGEPKASAGTSQGSPPVERAREAEQDSLLAGPYDEVVAVLREVRRVTGSPPPTVAAVAKVAESFPEVDLLALARELAYWSEHGNGARRQIKSVMGTFRSFAKRAEEDRRGRPAASQRPGEAVPSAEAQSWDRDDFAE